MKRRFPLIATFLTVAPVSLLPAQTLRGTVVDSSTSQPLPSVIVELVHADGQVVARGESQRDGRFSVRARDPGAYRVRAHLIGFRPFESPALILAPRRDTTLELRLAAVPVQLEGVTVEVVQDELLLQRGYYRRRESERGTFLDPAAVEKRALKAKVATDVLIGIPGVTIYQGAPRFRNCPNPRIYIDGGESGMDIMWSLQPNDILAVEVYRGPSQIPLVYGGTNTPCGVLLIWTKR